MVQAATWPGSLDESSLVKKWSIPMGPSYSGPIIVGDSVFVTETKDKKYEIVHALDRETGKKQWSTKWEGAIKVPFFARANGDWIRSTPAYDNGRLYVGEFAICWSVWMPKPAKEYGRSISSTSLVLPYPRLVSFARPLSMEILFMLRLEADFARLTRNPAT